MKRDMNLARKIMLELESRDSTSVLNPTDIEGSSPEEVSYHIMLLDEAGLIRAIDGSSVSDIYWFASRLTWEGHEFLEAAKDVSRWEQAKKMVAEKGGGMVYDVLKAVLVKLMTDAVMGKI
jgi:hypothetical protein